jgi:uncharacterized membrane protein YgcG
MAYLLKLHKFILRCRCGDPSKQFFYLDRARHKQSIHNLVNTGANMRDPRFDCKNVADTHAANFHTFEPEAVEMAHDIVNSPAKTAKEYGKDEFLAACALLLGPKDEQTSNQGWRTLTRKAETIFRLEDRANRIADVLSGKALKKRDEEKKKKGGGGGGGGGGEKSKRGGGGRGGVSKKSATEKRSSKRARKIVNYNDMDDAGVVKGGVTD